MAGSFFISCRPDGREKMQKYTNNMSICYEYLRKQKCIGAIEMENYSIRKYNRSSMNSYKIYQDNSGNTIVIDGVVFIDGYIPQSDIPCELLIQYLKYGDIVFQKLQGHFVITIISESNNTIKVITDINGLIDKYILCNGMYTVFCSSLLALAKSFSVSYNWKAFAEYIQMGQFISYETYFNEITRAEPAMIYTIEGNKIINKNNYWSFPDRVDKNIEFGEQIDKVGKLLVKYSKNIEHSFKNIECDLTGGTDSRLVVAAMRSCNAVFRASFFDPDGTQELGVVKDIIQKTGICFEHNKFIGRWPEDIKISDIVNLVWLSDGRIDPFDIFTTFYNQNLRLKKCANISINGIGVAYKEGWAEEMRIFKRKKFGIDVETILKYRIFKNYAKRYNIFSKDLCDHISKSYTEGLKDIKKLAKDCDGVVTPLAADIFYFKLLGHDDIACHYNISNQIITAASPLIFKEIIEQVGKGNQKWKRRYSRLQRNLIYSLDKELAIQKTLIGFSCTPYNVLNFYKAFPILIFQAKRFIRKFSKILFDVDLFLDHNKYDKGMLISCLLKDKVCASYLNYTDMESKILYEKGEFNKAVKEFYEKNQNIQMVKTIFLFECVIRFINSFEISQKNIEVL